MDNTVYEKLIDAARKGKAIPYQKLASECKLNLDMENFKDRAALSRILDEISQSEVEHHRPLLFAVVVSGEEPQKPFYGFFLCADRLRVRKPGESDEDLFERVQKECFGYWKRGIFNMKLF